MHQSALFLLFECASGYALFERLESEEIGQELADVQKSVTDLQRFGKVVKLKSFVPFKSAAHALENINDVTEGAALARSGRTRRRARRRLTRAAARPGRGRWERTQAS